MKDASPEPAQKLLLSFTSQEWSGRPAQDAVYICLGLSIVGFLVSMVLMIFIAGLRDPGAGSLFIAVFSVALTALLVWAKASSEKKFLTGINQRVNETVLELTGNPNDPLSLPDFRDFIEKERHIPLLVHGVPGLELMAVKEVQSTMSGRKQTTRVRTAPKNTASKDTPVVTTTRVVIGITPPDYGTASFDRLFQAALDPD